MLSAIISGYYVSQGGIFKQRKTGGLNDRLSHITIVLVDSLNLILISTLIVE